MTARRTALAMAGLACLLLCAGCASSTTQLDSSGGSGDLLARTQRYDFHCNVWLNLHHYLFDLARNHQDADIRAALMSQGLTAIDFEVWLPVLRYYREQLTDRSLLFDDMLFDVKRRLIEFTAVDTLKLDAYPELEGALRRTMPAYASHLWPAHREGARQRLERNIALIRRIENPVFERIAELARYPWPQDPVRVDLTYVANWAGAYASIQPRTHVVIQTSDWESDLDWLEILFHEPSHAVIHPGFGAVADAIRAAAGQAGVEAPRNLWHGILFYLAGTAVQEALAEEGIDYQLFMFRYDVFGRYHDTLVRHMPGYIQGRVSLQETVAGMIADLS